MSDDEAARKRRAAKLREQISKLKKPEADEEEEADQSEHQKTESGNKSPRDFINERMRELSEEDEKK